MVLDLPTLIVMTMVNLTIASVAALCVFRVNRPMPGLGNMAYGMGVICGGFAMAFFANPFAGRLAGWLGNSAMICGMFLILQGLRQFRGVRMIPWWLFGCLSLPYFSLQTWFLLTSHDNRPLRHFAFSSLIAVFCFAGAWTLSLRIPLEDRLTDGITALGLTVYGVMQVVRGIWVLLPGQGSIIDKGLVPALTLFVLNLCVIGCLLGITTATNLKLRKRIENLAFCDHLTGLPNRRLFDERLDKAHARSAVTSSPVTLVYIDLDHFKEINDRFGHGAGDSALRAVADRLRAAVHPDDCLARMGGDEFVVLTERFRCRNLALTLITQLQDALLTPIEISGFPVLLGISCGLAFYPDDVASPADLIREADAKMYVMKRRVPALR